MHADFELDQIERREGDEVEQERPGPHVVAGQLASVVHHQPLLQVTGAELDGHVQQEHDVAERVHGRPPAGRHALQLGQALPDDGRPQVVQRAPGEHHEPVEVEVLVRVDHGPRQLVLLPAQPAFPAHVLDVVLRTGTALAVIAGVQRLLKRTKTKTSSTRGNSHSNSRNLLECVRVPLYYTIRPEISRLKYPFYRFYINTRVRN